MPDSYSPCATFCPPDGRTAVMGKARAEIDKIRSSVAVDNMTVTNEQAKTALTATKIAVENQALTDKTEAEVRLLNQKAVTELAQVSDSVGTVGMSTGDVSGVILKQKELFEKQKNGFDRDAESKLAKIMVDTWSVRQTTDTADAASAGLDDGSISSILSRAQSGLGT